MKLRTIIPLLTVVLASLSSCGKQDVLQETYVSEARPWQFVMTKSGGTHTDEVRTYRASLLHNGNGVLIADGTYSGYYTENHWTETHGVAWPYPDGGWLYPCRTDGEGIALDTNGDPIAWDDADWFAKTDKDSKWGLRGPDRSDLTYALVMTSPAQEMVGFRPAGSPPLTTEQKRDPNNYHWGFPLDRKTSTWAVSPVVGGRQLTADYVNNNYIYSFTPTMLEHRAMLTVKVACGALDEANISKVYFKNVMSFAYYVPPRGNEGTTPSRTGNYEEVVIDGNDGSDGYDPLVSYYTDNTYPDSDGDAPGAGDKFIAPDGNPVHLVKRPGQTADFIPENEWQYFTADHEWVKGSDDKYVLTAIKDFPIMPLDYSTPEGDSYFYNDIMPKVVVYSGVNGDIRSTILVDANIEPMKKYTLYIYVSSVYIHAVLTVSDWTIFQFWPASDTSHSEKDVLDVSFGNATEDFVGELTVSDWRPVDTDPAQGVIENPAEEGSGSGSGE